MFNTYGIQWKVDYHSSLTMALMELSIIFLP